MVEVAAGVGVGDAALPGVRAPQPEVGGDGVAVAVERELVGRAVDSGRFIFEAHRYFNFPLSLSPVPLVSFRSGK